MSKIITLRKGLDINLRGKAQESLADAPQASEYALSPLDFEGVTPKLLVKVGDEVKAGTPLFFNKYSERVLFTSPVSGTVAAVNRGEKRKVLSVTVTPDATQSYEEFAKPDLQKASREEIVELLHKVDDRRIYASSPTRTTRRRPFSFPPSTPRRWPRITTSCSATSRRTSRPASR